MIAKPPIDTAAALLRAAMRRILARGFFAATCGVLGFAGTVSAAYPVTAVVVLAALASPRRCQSIALSAALGSAIGATSLVLAFHHFGWAWVYAQYPEFAAHAGWQKVTAWVSHYGIVALGAIAVSPLPQTPALIFFGVVQPEPTATFFTMLAAKAVKYGAVAWFASRFPERLRDALPRLLS